MDFLNLPDPSVNPMENLQVDSVEIKNMENIQALTLIVYAKNFIIEPNFKATKITTRLNIERSSGRFSEINFAEKIPTEFEMQKTFSAFLGIINILDKGFLLFADEVSFSGTLEEADIFQIATIAFIPFDKENENNSKAKEIEKYIQILRKVFSFGFYFSYKYDLTLSRIKLASGYSTDTQFQWNVNMFKEMISQNIEKKWMIPLIQGFFGNFSCIINEKKLDFYLITRRSCKRAGTRYNARGIDDDGNVANFCETEMMIIYNKYCCSHLQIRGSVPVFWQQRGFTAQTKITRNYDLTNNAFLKHIYELTKNYTRVLCVNLMAKNKPSEQMITEAYETHVRMNNLPNLRYEFFDFHHACKGQKFDRINPLLKKLQLMNENFRFYVEDTRNNSVLMTQKGIFRTNCLDCLDRTNFFLTKVSAVIFDFMMKHLEVDLTQVFGQDILSQMDNNNQKQNHPFIIHFKNIWADNGDYISKHYTGTGSTHTNVTRTGKRDFFGLLDHGMKSIGRFYKQNFEDSLKQEGIDMILGQHTETTNVFLESLEKELKLRERDFCKFEEVRIFVVDWNVNGFEPSPTFDLSKELFNLEENPSPDIVVICLQDIYPYSPKNVMAGNPEKVISNWSKIILGTLEKLTTEEYIQIKDKEAFGCLLLLFAKGNLKNRITKVSYDTMKFGLISNRGAIVIKFAVDDTSFAVINCHLEGGGPKNFNSRIFDINEVHLKSFQSEGVGKKKEEKIESLDFKFLCGDMNFAINLPDQDVRQFIEAYENNLKMKKLTSANDILKYLLSHDEFITSKTYSEYLMKYQEASINFMPTAKYEPYSTAYNSSFLPAWYDRIMIWANDGYIIKQYFYNRKEYMDSTHRPVTAYYALEVKTVFKEKKEEIIKQIYENQKNIEEEDELEGLEEESKGFASK